MDNSAVSSIEDVITEAAEEVSSFWTGLWDWFVQVGPKILWAAIIFVVSWWLSGLIVRLLRKALLRTDIDRSGITFLCSMSKYALRLIAILLTLTPFGFEVGTAFAALGAAGITLGLGLKETVANLASGVQIIITKPFQVGHYILINQMEGTVTRVEIMFTTLKTLDYKEVVIPNSVITAGVLTNYTSLGIRRVDFNYCVRYGTDIARLRELLMELAQKEDMVLQDPAPLFAVMNQGANGLEVSLRVYCKHENYWSVFFDMQEKIKALFEQNDIQVPFNQVDLYLHPDGSPITTPTEPKK